MTTNTHNTLHHITNLNKDPTDFYQKQMQQAIQKAIQ